MSAMTNWLVTGAAGMLGRDLVDVLQQHGARFTAVDHPELDITDAAAVHARVAGHDVVINAAAWTDVDGAEADESGATAVNGAGAGNLAAACAATGARLLHLSTDYVFAGDATAPYPEDAPTAPINAYGRSKLAGEVAVRELLPAAGYVVRTAWLYGANGRNFVTTMLKLATDRDTLDVVRDQRGQPTWSYSLARRLVELGERARQGAAPAGTYHATSCGVTTWYDFARAIFEEAGLDPDRVHPTTSDRFPRPARRPSYSVLGHARWRDVDLSPLPDWRAMLHEACEAPGLLG